MKKQSVFITKSLPFLKRPAVIAEDIINNFEPPITIDGFLSTEDLLELKKIAQEVFSSKDGVHDSKYMRVGDAADLHEKYPLVKKIINEKIKPLLRLDCFIERSFIAQLKSPTTVHADSGFITEEKPYKLVHTTVDLHKSVSSYPLVLFKQRTTGSKSQFLYGREGDEFTATNSLNIYEKYWHVEDFTDKPFDIETHKKYLSHLPYDQLYGLSVDKIIEPRIGDMVIFDGCQIHCSGSYPEQEFSRMIFNTYFFRR